MKHEKSCGAIVFTRINNQIKYVIIESLTGIYGFPKGHVENSETEKETAVREIFEEVGLQIEFIENFRECVEYYIPSVDIQKQVVYFLGEYSNQEIIFQKEELISAQLLTFEETMTVFTHDNNKELLKTAKSFIENL